MRIVLIVIFLSNFVLAKGQDRIFDGYYVEVFLKKENDRILNGGYLVDSVELCSFFENLEYDRLFQYYDRIFDHTSETFRRFDLTLPQSTTYQQLDWNHSIQLSHISDPYFGYNLFSISENNYMVFYVKKVKVLITPILTGKPNVSSQKILDFSELNNYLLLRIFDCTNIDRLKLQAKCNNLNSLNVYCEDIKCIFDYLK